MSLADSVPNWANTPNDVFFSTVIFKKSFLFWVIMEAAGIGDCAMTPEAQRARLYSEWAEGRTEDLRNRVFYLLVGAGNGEMSQKTARQFADLVEPSKLEAVVAGKPAFPLNILAFFCRHYGAGVAAEYVKLCKPDEFYDGPAQTVVFTQAVSAFRRSNPDEFDQLPDELRKTAF